MEATLPATPRHTRPSLPLLPSGPDGVCDLALRGDRQGHHNTKFGNQLPELDVTKLNHSCQGVHWLDY